MDEPKESAIAPEVRVCAKCQDTNVEPGYAASLCQECRTDLVYRPVPLGIIVAAIIVGLGVAVAGYRFPETLSYAIHDTRGKNAQEAHNYTLATAEYKTVLKKYPNYTDGWVNMTVDAYKSHDFVSAMNGLAKLEGKDLSKSQRSELDDVSTELTDLDDGTTKGRK